MGLRDFFGFRREAKQEELKVPESQLVRLDNAAQFLAEARCCLNSADGPEFVSGVRAAFIPLQQFVKIQTGEEAEFGDTLHEFARLTRNNPDGRLSPLLALASKMKRAPASGVRFIVADLILAYARVGVFPQGSPAELVVLQAESLAVLKIASQYG